MCGAPANTQPGRSYRAEPEGAEKEQKVEHLGAVHAVGLHFRQGALRRGCGCMRGGTCRARLAHARAGRTPSPSAAPLMYCCSSTHSCALVPCSRNWKPCAVTRVSLGLVAAARTKTQMVPQPRACSGSRSPVRRPAPDLALGRGADQTRGFQQPNHGVRRPRPLLLDAQHVVQHRLERRYGGVARVRPDQHPSCLPWTGGTARADMPPSAAWRSGPGRRRRRPRLRRPLGRPPWRRRRQRCRRPSRSYAVAPGA